MRYIKFLKYLLTHKILVFKECVKLGIIWKGITHDLSKLGPAEFKPYAKKFFSKEKPSGKEWRTARLHHLRKNPHHYQYHIIVDDEGKMVIEEMSEKDVKEMIADWTAISYNTRKLSLHEWYEKNREIILLHPNTKLYIEKLLNDK